MKRSYRILLMLVLASLLVALAACGGAPATPAEQEAPAAEPTEASVDQEPTAAAEEPAQQEETQPAEEESEPAADTEQEQASTEEVDRAHTLIIAIPGDVETIDPAFGAATRANETLKNIYDPLVHYAAEDSGEGYSRSLATEFDPALAESWEVSDDGLTIVLNLREGVTFPMTGNEFTADDFIYKVERAFGVGAGTQWLLNTAGVKSADQVEKTGDYQVTISLDSPSPIFFNLMRDQDWGLIDSQAVKEHATDDDPWATQWLAKNYAGAGEYVLENWEPGVEFAMRANDQYWGEQPYFKKVILQIIPSSTDRALLLQQGSVDVAADLSLSEMQSIEGAEGVKIVSIPSREQLVVGLNNQMEPFTDPTVRQALAYAVPYDTIVNDVYGGAAGLPQGVFPGNSEWHDSNVEWPYTTDLDKARELLAEAGYADGFEFTLAIQQGISTMEEIAVILQDSFRQIGVDMSIDKQSAAVFQEHMAKKEQPAWMRPVLAYVDDPFYMMFLSYQTGQVVNWQNYSNERIDEITDELAVTIDQEERRALSTEAQEIMTEDLPLLFLAETNRNIATREDIGGWVVDPDPLLKYAPLRRAE